MRRILNCYVGGKGGALSLSCSLGLSVDRWIGDAGDAGERFCAGLGYAPGVRAGRAMRYFVRCRAQRRRKDRGMGAHRHRGRGSCLIKGTQGPGLTVSAFYSRTTRCSGVGLSPHTSARDYCIL